MKKSVVRKLLPMLLCLSLLVCFAACRQTGVRGISAGIPCAGRLFVFDLGPGTEILICAVVFCDGV